MLRPTRLPKSQFWREQISLQNIARSRQRALRGAPRRLLAASAPSRDPRTGGWRGGALSSMRRAGEPRLAAGGARGGGARRRAHSTPAANSPHKVGFVSGPRPLTPGKQQRNSQRGKGAAGSAKASPVPSRARLSGRTAGTRRRSAPAEPSRGAGPVPGPGVQRGRLGRRAEARLRSPSGGLRPRGRSLGVAAAWAVARPAWAKDAPRRSARAPAAPAGMGQDGGAEDGPPDWEGSRLAQPQPADGAGGE